MRYLRVTRPSGGASHVYATPPEEIRVVPLVNEVEGAVERVRAFRDGQIRYFDRDRATGKVVASSAKLSTLHEDLVDAAETAAMLGPGAPTPWLSGEGEDEFVVRGARVGGTSRRWRRERIPGPACRSSRRAKCAQQFLVLPPSASRQPSLKSSRRHVETTRTNELRRRDQHRPGDDLWRQLESGTATSRRLQRDGHHRRRVST